MPIVVKDFYWNQNETSLFINLPLKGTKAANVDIINSQEFCKVSYPPFIFESWFFDRVDDENSLTTINNGMVSLQFTKLNPKLWPTLFHPEHENKDLLRQIRESALIFVRDKTEHKSKEKAELIANNKKTALKEQMQMENDDRLRIQNIKETEKTRATEEIEKFKEISKATFASKASLECEKISTEKNNKENFKIKTDPNKQIFDGDTAPEIVSVKKKDKPTITPDPRNSSVIQVKFTHRVFPTPSRESQEKMENEWLQNQLEARKIAELPKELGEYSKDEINIDWLKDKANQFYKIENYQAAISVYTHAIKLYPKMSSLYSNRAACHFQIRNLIKCIEDCTRALDLLNPPVESNLQSRLKAHIRRGTAFCELELYPEGLADYEAALKLDPNNDEIKRDSENIRRTIQENPID